MKNNIVPFPTVLSQPIENGFHRTYIAAPEQGSPAGNDEFSALMRTCMARLPSRQREVLALRNDSHRSNEEIARMLGIHVRTVDCRLVKARNSVRSLLTGMNPEIAPDAGRGDWFETFRHNNDLTLSVA